MNIERVARALLGASALCGLLVTAGCNGTLSSNNSGGPPGGTPVPAAKPRVDWGASLLAGGTVGVGMYPAKFTFDITAAPSCANDYVAFNTSLAGGASLTAASQTGSVGGTNFAQNDTVTIGNPTLGTTLVLTASDTVNTGTNFLDTGTAATQASNLATAITRAPNGPLVGVTAAAVGSLVTVTATSAGSGGNLITLAKSVASPTTFSWTSGTLINGSGTASIVALNNLYSTQGSAGGLCNQDGPSVDWAYYTGTGTAVTSVVLSEDGTKVAFVENVGGTATLRVLKWKAGEGSSVGAPVAVDQNISGANWSTCTAGNSCMSSIAFSGAAATDTKSSPFYVYRTNDVLYAGDDSGRVHKFTGVFFGTPAEVTSAPWPITVNAGAILTSPIYDSVSGNIFVGDSTGLLSYIREATSGVGTCVSGSAPCLGTPSVHIGGTGGSIDDAPVVDGNTQKVIAINSTDATWFGTLLQADTALTVPSQVSVEIGGSGVGGNGSPIYSGAFDNTYFISSPGSITGHMYVCGKARANRDRPAVYQLNFNSSGTLVDSGTNWLGGPSGDLVSASGEACSPVTEFFNSTTAKDWIFFSVGNNTRSANPIPLGVCTAGTEPLPFGCVLSADVTGNPAWPPSVLAGSARTPGNTSGSTSGVVVDNQADTIASPQASSFYFTFGSNSVGAGPGAPSCSTTAGVGCAVKLTQAAVSGQFQ
jgi:hypothetical protein